MNGLLVAGIAAGVLLKPLRPVALICILALVFFHPIKSLVLFLSFAVLRAVFG